MNRKISVFGKLVPHEHLQKTWDSVFLAENLFFHNTFKHHFWTGLSQAMRSGFSSIMLNVVVHVLIEEKDQFSNREQNPISKRSCWVCGGEWMQSSITNFWITVIDYHTITAMLYRDRLRRLKAALIQKRSSLVSWIEVIFHHDNALLHAVQMTKDHLREFGWKIMSHPAYSPDLAPSDCHLFRGLQNHLDGLRLTFWDRIEQESKSYFTSKAKKMYKQDILKLVGGWKKF